MATLQSGTRSPDMESRKKVGCKVLSPESTPLVIQPSPPSKKFIALCLFISVKITRQMPVELQRATGTIPTHS